MTKCDDKSGYDHVSLSPSSQTYVGFQWNGFWFVCTTLPFGWKISPYIYHTIGPVASRYLSARGIPCSLYIDDRLNGELLPSFFRHCQGFLNSSLPRWHVLRVCMQMMRYTTFVSSVVISGKELKIMRWCNS